MPTDVEVCQANPASFFAFGPYAWQPFGILIQNRSNIVLYMNDGNYCDEVNYRFLVPPYYQGAVLTANKEISFKFDKNGTIGPVPQLERATIFITDTFMAPGLFPFAATVRDTLNSTTSIAPPAGTGTLTATSPVLQAGLYEIYGWSAQYVDMLQLEGDVSHGQLFLTLVPSVGTNITLDVGVVNNGGRDVTQTTFNQQAHILTQGNGGGGLGPTYTLSGAATTIGQKYRIWGWGAWIEDAAGGAADGKQFQAGLSHTETGVAFDTGVGMTGGLTNANRVPLLGIDKWFPGGIDYTPAGAGNFRVLAIAPAAFANAPNVQMWIRYSPVSQGILPIGGKLNAESYSKVFVPPLLVQVQSGTTANLVITLFPSNTHIVGNQNFNVVIDYAPLRF